MPQRIMFDTRADWLRARQEDVTSTESAALFGLSPYSTPFELYHLKRGAIDDSFQANERTNWGVTLERAIAQQVAETYGVKIRSLNYYYRHDECRMGASFDFEIVGIVGGGAADTTLQELYRQHGAGILEIKNVDGLIYRDQWNDEEAPPHIEVQTQHQLEVCDRGWCAIAVLVGGNSLKLYPRLRDREVGASLRFRTGEFWDRIVNSNPPPVDWKADAGTIAKLYGHAEPGTFADLRDDEELTDLCARYQEAGRRAKEADDDKQAIKSQILVKVGEVEKVAAAGYTLSLGVVAESDVSYHRNAYRNFRITAKKVKA